MLKIKNRIDFENNLFVGEVDASLANSSQEERIKFVTDIASINSGRSGFDTSINNSDGGDFALKHWNKRKKIYNKLLTEAAGKASTHFEFIPARIPYTSEIFGDMNDVFFLNNIMKCSYIIKSDEYFDLLTNMRTLLNAGIKEEDIPFNTPKEVEEFKVIISKLPKIAYDDMVYTQLSKITESSRNRKYLNEVEFLYPSEWNEGYIKVRKDQDDSNLQHIFNCLKLKYSKAEDATKELSCRRLMLSSWAGWKQDENTWNNLFNQRSVKHTQSITKIVVGNIKKLINNE